MPDSAPPGWSRRCAVAALLPAILVGAAAPAPRIVTILGDSITAGLGLPRSAALPARLQTSLRRRGLSVIVRGAGVSGDTTAAGLARLSFSVQADTDLVVVALGANDLLRGLDPKRTGSNLDKIIKTLLARRMRIVLAGVQAPSAAGPRFSREFNAVFRVVATRNRVPLYPDLLAGVAGTPRLNQSDGIHPNAQGVEIVATRLAPVVAQALK
jgi:acyl-CoA thioesterase-1